MQKYNTLADVMIEDSAMIYYMDTNGIVQDGNDWLEDFRHDEIDLDKLQSLKECYWSPLKQQWIKEAESIRCKHTHTNHK